MSRVPPSMYASTAALIGLVAVFPDDDLEPEMLWENEAVNSCFGTIPLR